MAEPDATDEPPDRAFAYRFRLPTGGLNEDGELAYREWTSFLAFSGDWELALAFGVVRSTERRPQEVETEADVFWFPDVLHEPTGDAAADELLAEYKRHLVLMDEGPRPPIALCRRAAARAAQNPQQSVLVYLSLSDDALGDAAGVEAIHRLSAELGAAIERTETGVFDGDEFGEGTCTLFMYGSDADGLFAAIEPVLRGSPVARGAKVRRSYGEPWEPDLREVETEIEP